MNKKKIKELAWQYAEKMLAAGTEADRQYYQALSKYYCFCYRALPS